MKATALSEALDGLRTGFADDPEGLRAFCLELLCELSQSSGAAWYRFGMVDGNPLPVQWLVREARHEVALSRHLAEQIPWPHGDPRLPDRRWNRRFLRMSSLISMDAFAPTKLFRRCWGPAGIHDQLRLVVYHRDEFVGWIGAVRAQGEPPFRRADLRRVSPLADALSDALIHAHSIETSGGIEGCDLLLRPDGSVEHASEEGWRLVASPGGLDDIRAWVSGVDHDERHARVLHGNRVRWSRLFNEHGSRYLLHLDPIAPLRMHATYVLSRTQREMAALASAGATVEEIAQMSDLMASTVRAHLRQVYQRLGVNNRAELTGALEGMPPTP